ncbi:hypothetical protein [Occallatibacter savannae]|uniref:hypothetical protein n=1 Tax=Occallatibacter savannae TaxID=1002691 RepID=UPI000D697A5F|nr:hypothetical protein [Occallatibacter savannae]
MKSICLLPLRFTAAAAVLTLICIPVSARTSRPQTTTVRNVQSAYAWSMTQDIATGSGVATGAMALVSSPSLSGAARQFGISFQNSAGERYWSVFGNDAAATNFTYDVKVYIPRLPTTSRTSNST